MRRYVLPLALLLAVAPARAGSAQSAVARRDVYVRASQTTRAASEGVLAGGDTAALVSPAPVRGYYNLRTPQGVTGWAYGRFLQLLAPKPAGGDASPAAAATDSAPPHGGASATAVAGGAVAPTWEKPTPVTHAFARGALGSCGPDGQGGDALTNHRKNRVDEPALYHPVTFDALLALPYPRNHLQSRAEWSSADLATIAPYEGAAVTVTAFVARQRGVLVQDGSNSHSGESTNCHALDDAGVDWHVTLVKHPDDPKSAGIVVETTPRVRANGHHWTPTALRTAAAAGDSVRISGWLLYDPEHFAETSNYDPARPTAGTKVRATLWEIHPVTRIEVFEPATGTWRALP